MALCSSSIPQAALGLTGTLPSLASFGLEESHHLLEGAGERVWRASRLNWTLPVPLPQPSLGKLASSCFSQTMDFAAADFPFPLHYSPSDDHLILDPSHEL